MAADAKSRLKEIVDSYLEKDGGSSVDTGIVASHIAQMKLFGIRQGVEFFPSQDNFGGQRKDFIDRVLKYNKMDIRLDSIWEYFFVMARVYFIFDLQNLIIGFIISALTSTVLSITLTGSWMKL
jgi:hypothetical protein